MDPGSEAVSESPFAWRTRDASSRKRGEKPPKMAIAVGEKKDLMQENHRKTMENICKKKHVLNHDNGIKVSSSERRCIKEHSHGLEVELSGLGSNYALTWESCVFDICSWSHPLNPPFCLGKCVNCLPSHVLCQLRSHGHTSAFSDMGSNGTALTWAECT